VLALLLLAALGIGAFAADRWTRDAGTGGTPSPAGTAIAALTPAPPALQPTSAPSPISAATPPSAPSLTAPAQLTAGPTPAAPATPPLAAQGSVAAERALAALPGTTSAIVVAGGVATGRDAERRMPAASLIKLFIAGETYRQVAAGQLGLTDRFTVRQSDVVGGTGILQRQVGATYTLDEMVEIMLVESDNTAANMLIDRLGGFAPVNGFITGLGLSEGTRLNRRLLDTAAQARGVENTTTARDVASFYEQLRAGQVVNPTASRRIVDILARRAGRDRNWLLLDLPPGAGVAHINGTNPGVRNDAAIITGEAGPYILVVLVQHADEAAAERAIARVSLDIYNANRR
jgi:beta-lactamase class A